MKSAYPSVLTVVALAVLTAPIALVRGEDFLYETNNGTITITKYNGPGGDVSIPGEINGLPVTSIGNYAFSSCTNLTSITIPQSVTSIGELAFTDCPSLSAIAVDTTNPSYSSVDGVLFTKNQATLIYYPHKGTTYVIPNTVTSIGDYAFYRCSSLTSVLIPSSVTSIGYSVFYGCSSLTNIAIPDSVTTVGEAAFHDCSSLTSVTIGNSVTGIGGTAFYGCGSLTSVTIPNNVTSIGQLAFNGCSSLTSVTIGKSVAIIGWSAFLGCRSLTSVTIPNSVTNIGWGAFSFCSGLTSVTIPNSVAIIGYYAFGGCSGLSAITVDPTNPSYSSVDGVLFNKDQTTLINYPSGKLGAAYTIPNTVRSIQDAAFAGCTNLTAVHFQGNAPSVALHPNFPAPQFQDATNVTVYHLPGTLGWANTYAERPTGPWVLPHPVILTTAPNFGIQTNAFGFRISWATNAFFVVETSTSLANPNWSAVSTNTLTGGWVDFRDAEWTNYPARFYRVRQW